MLQTHASFHLLSLLIILIVFLFDYRILLKGNGLNPSVYCFIFDRLRSLRQDLIIQGIRNDVTREVLESCVRFHLISGNLLCNEKEVIKFDPVINYSHLLECLKSLLNLYHELDTPYDSEDRIDMTCVYLLIQLGTKSPLLWILGQDSKLRHHPRVRRCIKINAYCLERNYVALFRQFKSLTKPNDILTMHWSLTKIYGDLFRVMTAGFSSVACKYPLMKFANLFALSMEEMDEMTFLFGVRIIQDEDNGTAYLQFNKKTLKSDAKIERKQWNVISEKITNVPLQTFMVMSKE